MRCYLIGNPENRRVHPFQSALERLGFQPATVVPYAELLRGRWFLLDEIRGGDVVRIESPGENADVERGLILRGAARESLSKSDLFADFPIEHGRIYRPQWWFAGFRDLLAEIERRLQGKDVRWMNAPAEICEMFDKSVCQARLEQVGLPVPPSLGDIENFEQLQERMRAMSMSRVFVKLRSASSASGVVALQIGGDRMSATTSVEMVRCGGSLKLFNSLRVRRYTSHRDVADLVNALCQSGVHVERWIPKAGWQGETFDLRIVVIGGQVRHTVMRASHGPLTNLHLGNRRGNVREFLESLPSSTWNAAQESCRRVSEVFPRSLYFGIDLMFTPGLRCHFLLEVNAFGDLLPGVLCGEEDTFAAEIRDFWREA